MHRYKKILSLILCLVIIGCSCVITVSAESKTAYINDSGVRLRSAATTQNSENIIATLSANSVVTVNSTVTGEEINGNSTWYNVTYNGQTGYVHGDYVSFPPSSDDYVYDADFEKNIENFPESYRDALRALHSKYPNWQFVAHNVDLSFKQAVEAQYGVSNVKDTRKWVEFTYGGNEWRDMRGYDAASDTWVTLESRWTYASRAAIEYFMDPRNSLNEEKIFAFMQQSYKEDENVVDNLRSVIKGTFLENGYDKDGDGNIDKDAYIEDLLVAARDSGVSAYVLAATIIVEQGVNGGTNLVSGEYKYTYTDATTGETIVEDYTGYYNFFNYSASGSTKDDIARSGLAYAKSNGWNSIKAAICGGAANYADGYIDIGQDTYYYKDFNVVNKVWWHQYASALYDAWTNAKYLKKGCSTNTDATIVFIIPIYEDLPNENCSIPSEVVIPEPEPIIKKGDTNSDDKVNAIDLAAVKMHILGVKTLEGNAAKAGDVNGDGAINAIDLAAVKMHILGVKTIA